MIFFKTANKNCLFLILKKKQIQFHNPDLNKIESAFPLKVITLIYAIIIFHTYICCNIFHLVCKKTIFLITMELPTNYLLFEVITYKF